MKKIIRSIVFVSITKTPEAKDLKENILRLLDSKWWINLKTNLDCMDSELKVLQEIIRFYNEHQECPDIVLLNDKYDKEGNVNVIAFLRDIVTELPLIGKSFQDYLDTKFVQWQRCLMQKILNDSWRVANDGLPIGKITLQGVEESVKYYNSKTHLLGINQGKYGIIDLNNIDLMQNILFPGNKVLRYPWAHMQSEHVMGPGELIVWASPTGGAKSTALDFNAGFQIQDGHSGLTISLEAPAAQVHRRYFCSVYNNFINPADPIPERSITKATITSEHLIAFNNIPIILEEKTKKEGWGIHRIAKMPRASASDVKNLAISFKNTLYEQGKTLDFIQLDYLGLMEPVERRVYGSEQTIVLNRVILEVAQLSLEMEIPFICAFQLNREAMRKMSTENTYVNKRPRLFHLSYANECERSASQVMLIHNVLDTDVYRETEMIMAKYRNGIGGDGIIYTVSLNMDTKVYKIMQSLSIGPEGEKKNLNINFDA